MNCEAVREHLSAWIDNELAVAKGHEVERHLVDCESCAGAVEELRALNGELDGLFATDRQTDTVVDQVMNRIAASSDPPLDPTAAKRERVSEAPSIAAWLASLVVATAAGFLIAMLFFAPPNSAAISRDSDSEDHSVQNPDVAQTPLQEGPSPTGAIFDAANPPGNDLHFATVNVATGPVEVTSIGLPSLTCPSYPIVPVGMQMRTGPRKCELTTPGGSTIRLDCDTLISFPKKNELVLEKGRLWCSQRGNSPMTVTTNGTSVMIENAVCAFECGNERTELATYEGEVQVAGGAWSNTVKAGKRIRYRSGELLDETGIENPVIATRWIHELLLRKNGDDAELTLRVEKLWAALGYSKMQHLYEYELRCIGSSCVASLSAYLKSDAIAHQETGRRIQAAKIVADVAEAKSTPLFVDLLNDKDGEVRYHAARGLLRLTGRSFASSPEQWRTANREERARWQEQWRAWLRTESERFPRLEVPEDFEENVLPSKL